MQPRRAKIHLVWNYLTAVTAFLLTALVNVAAMAPAGETQLTSSSCCKQLEAVAGVVRGVVTASPAGIDGDSTDGDAEPAIVAALPGLYRIAALPASSIPADSTRRRGPLALRAGLSRAPPSI